MVYITNVYLTHAKKSQVKTESTVDIKTLVYTKKTSLWILKLSKTKLIKNTKTKNKRLILLFGLRVFTFLVRIMSCVLLLALVASDSRLARLCSLPALGLDAPLLGCVNQKSCGSKAMGVKRLWSGVQVAELSWCGDEWCLKRRDLIL